jgi:ribonuclease D
LVTNLESSWGKDFPHLLQRLPARTGFSSTMNRPAFTWISSADTYHVMVEMLAQAGRLAVDIEADSLYHYFEKVCLIQISTDTRTYVIDPLVVRSLSELGRLMADPAIEKVFHAAAYGARQRLRRAESQ